MHQDKPLLFGGSLSAKTFLQTTMQKNVLGMLCFTSNYDVVRALKAKSKVPCLHVPMKSLGDSDAFCEFWSSLGPLQQETAGAIHYQYDDDVLFGVMHLPESAFQATTDKTPLQQTTVAAYHQIFTLIERLKYPHVFRFWNYIPSINMTSFKLERYRQFNLGRQEAFLAFQRDVVGNVPVACALGFNAPEQAGLSIAFMAGRVQPTVSENPRQISAYQYPEQYGPVSPTFSRASLVKLTQSELLLISGTASIVGHATQHDSDAVVQTREAMMNIEAVLGQANAIASHATYSLADLHYRVYVRHPAHVVEIHNELMRHLSINPNVEYCQADICRQDLLLEIEASAEYPLVPSVEVKD
jgi:enamine deaminase RidA (YjgF/YER057c/UK114 family)